MCAKKNKFTNNTIISAQQCRLSLELNHVVQAGLLLGDKINAAIDADVIKHLSANIQLASNLQKKLVKINTGLVYKQQKYNLLHEESEGYSKLLNILHTFPAPAPVASPVAGSESCSSCESNNTSNNNTQSHDSLVSSAITSVLSTTGYFDLDPNRVLDIILDMFISYNIWNYNYIKLLKYFRVENLLHILGNKFVMCAIGHIGNESNPPPAEPSIPVVAAPVVPAASSSKSLRTKPVTPVATTPQTPVASTATPDLTAPSLPYTPIALYQLAALLIKEHLIVLTDLLPYLSHPRVPKTHLSSTVSEMVQSMVQYIEQKVTSLNQKSKSYGQVSLNTAAASSSSRCPHLASSS